MLKKHFDPQERIASLMTLRSHAYQEIEELNQRIANFPKLEPETIFLTEIEKRLERFTNQPLDDDLLIKALEELCEEDFNDPEHIPNQVIINKMFQIKESQYAAI